MEYRDGRFGVLEAAKFLECHPQTVRQLIKDGKLPKNKCQGKWVFTHDELAALVNYVPQVGRHKGKQVV